MTPLPAPDTPDRDLLAGSIDGDAGAFAGFCVRSLPTLLRCLADLARRLGVSEALAEDAAQEAFVRAVARRRADPGVVLSLGWLVRVGQNLLRDWARRGRRSIAAAELEDMPAAPPADDGGGDEELWDAVEKLSTAERTVIELVLIEGIDLAAVAARLGISAAAAYKRYERALAHLRELMGGAGE